MKRVVFLVLILLLVTACCWSSAFAEYEQGAVDEEFVIDPNADPILLQEGDPAERHAGVDEAESDAYTPRLFMDPGDGEKTYARVLLSTSHTAVFARFHGSYCMYDSGTPILLPQSDIQYLLTYEPGESGEPGEISISLDDEVLYTGTTLTFTEHAGTDNYFEINNCKYGVSNYQGSLTCYNATSNGTGLYLVNRVYIEDYLPGVVAAEIGNSYNIEALKAQAVAARGYIYSKVVSPINALYDAVDTSSNQVYWGKLDSSFANSINAVLATSKQLLLYNNTPIIPYYSASNGGYTQLVTSAWTGSPAYIGTMQYDEYDIIYGRNYYKNTYLEEVTINKTGGGGEKDAVYAAAVLSKNGINASTIDQVTSLTLSVDLYAIGKSGVVCYDFATLNVTATGIYNGSISFNKSGVFTALELENDIYGFKNDSLSCFWLVDNGSTYTLRHGRYGHGVGLSQIGARQRGSSGQTVSDILTFYYPGTSLSTDYIGDRETLSAKPSITDDMRVTRSDGYLYAAADSTSLKMTFVAAGSSVEIMGENDSLDYYYLNYGGTIGYLPKSAFALTCSTVVIQNISEKCNVRSSPDTTNDSNIIGTALKDAVYPLRDANAPNGWHQVQFNGA